MAQKQKKAVLPMMMMMIEWWFDKLKCKLHKTIIFSYIKSLENYSVIETVT
jgi:hypothetical protein